MNQRRHRSDGLAMMVMMLVVDFDKQIGYAQAYHHQQKSGDHHTEKFGSEQSWTYQIHNGILIGLTGLFMDVTTTLAHRVGNDRNISGFDTTDVLFGHII